MVEGYYRQQWAGQYYNIEAGYASKGNGFYVSFNLTPASDANIGVAYTSYEKAAQLMGMSGLQQSSRGWDAANTTLGAFGLASGIKETMIEGGAALTRGTKIYNVNTTSLIRTYGVSGAIYLKYSKALGVAGSVVSTGYSGYNVYEQYNKGGVNEVFQHRDVWDAGVGAAGLGATGLAAFGIISNPVGWGIGIGVLIYGGATLIYDAINND